MEFQVELKETDENQLDTELSMDAITTAMGEDAEEFLEAMVIIQGIIDDPSSLSGRQAVVQANRLAALRTKIGVKAQYYKTAAKTINNRRRKDVLMTMFTALEENINTLKLLGRVEASIIGQRP